MATQRRWCRVSAKLEHTWWRHSGWVRAGATPRCLPPSVVAAERSPAGAWACRFGHRQHGSPGFVRDSPGLAPRQGRTCSHPRLLLLRGITYRVCAAGRRVHAWKAAMQVRLLRRLQRAGHCRPLWTKHRLRTLATPRSRTYAWYVPRRGSTVLGLLLTRCVCVCVWRVRLYWKASRSSCRTWRTRASLSLGRRLSTSMQSACASACSSAARLAPHPRSCHASAVRSS